MTSQVFEFLKIWDLLVYSERDGENACLPKISILLQVGGEKI